jgi:hypothetical protein
MAATNASPSEVPFRAIVYGRLLSHVFPQHEGALSTGSIA